MTKKMKQLEKILAHQKSARHHLREAAELCRNVYQHSQADALDRASVELDKAARDIQYAYGDAAMSSLRRAR